MADRARNKLAEMEAHTYSELQVQLDEECVGWVFHPQVKRERNMDAQQLHDGQMAKRRAGVNRDSCGSGLVFS
jgi:hypothetical protein